jgi:hypothetical protein
MKSVAELRKELKNNNGKLSIEQNEEEHRTKQPKMNILDACKNCNEKCKIEVASKNAELLCCPQFNPKSSSIYKKYDKDFDTIKQHKGYSSIGF